MAIIAKYANNMFTRAYRAWRHNYVVKMCMHAYLLLRTGSLWLALGYGRTDYEVLEFEDFLTAEECDHIIRIARERGDMVQSTVSNEKGLNVVDKNIRQSYQCWLSDDHDEIVRRLSERVNEIVPLPISHQEDLQVVRYTKNEFYRRHFDTPYQEAVVHRFNRYCGPRVATFLIYLNDDFEGGETDFLLINKTVVPKRGKAILFYNIDINLSLIPESIHVGRRVRSGTKWIANKWIRVFPFCQRPGLESQFRVLQHEQVPWLMKITKLLLG